MPLYTSYSEETQTQIEEFLENTWNWDEDELVDFIEKYGEQKFKTDFEDYAAMVDDIGIDVVEAFLDSRANDQESFTFTPPGEGFTKTGTYSQSGTTVTITISNHGVAIGDVLTIDYTSGSATDGSFTVATAVDANTFTVTAASSATNSGNVSITLSGAKKFVCETWSKSIPYNNRASISATFRQVFEA